MRTGFESFPIRLGGPTRSDLLTKIRRTTRFWGCYIFAVNGAARRNMINYGRPWAAGEF